MDPISPVCFHAFDDIHFIHVRSKHEKALPVIVTHGWPGSIIEELKVIDPLVNPTAHGGRAEDAFDVVITTRTVMSKSLTPLKDVPRARLRETRSSTTSRSTG